MTDLLFTILIMSLVCCGATVISEKGMILYFLRNPFLVDEENWIMAKPMKWLNKARGYEYGVSNNIGFYIFVRNAMRFVGKPFITCCTCMASLWGGATYYLLHGFNLNIIPAILATAFLNSVFINYYYSKT